MTNRFLGHATTWMLATLLAMIVPIVSAPTDAMAKGRFRKTVHIRGTAYAFFDIDDRVPGAVVRVDEYPHVSGPVAADGSYEIEVPDEATITPYIDVPEGYERIYLQTFHTSGEDLEHVNFQVVPTEIYLLLAGFLGVPLDENDKLEQCAIASTFSIHEARDATTFDPGFKSVYPHGLPGATVTMSPRWGDTRGPIYFNEFVLPDETRTSSSVDGGVLWAEVPAGYYWLEPSHPTERIAPVLVHCEDGRLVNANPPWGLYELKDGEEPDPAVMVVKPTDDRQTARDQKRITNGLKRNRRLPVKLFK